MERDTLTMQSPGSSLNHRFDTRMSIYPRPDSANVRYTETTALEFDCG